MDEHTNDKKYESHKIPNRQQIPEEGGDPSLSQMETAPVSQTEDTFYEIEYDTSPIPGVGKFVLKSQKIDPPETDEIREVFQRMREIARAHHSALDYSRFFDRRVHKDNSIIFHKQGMLMKDFTDDYTEDVPFSSYFPYYQMMGYEQLRTYFSWRTEIRKGTIVDTSLSYAFLYLYELLNNIGVDDAQDGLTALLSFWRAFRVYNKTIDKYVLRWLKDYHIYYDLPQSFKEFVDTNGLAEHYPSLMDPENQFDLFCAISKYDIRKSAFFAEDRINLVTDCFYYIISELQQVFADNGIPFEESIYQPTKTKSVWSPFRDALFHPWIKQRDRQIVLSEKEIYRCSDNKWVFNTSLTTESSRQFIGYLMKQMESVLRKLTKYTYTLSANFNFDAHPAVYQLREAGFSLETIVTDAVLAFYREETKTIVTVEHGALSKIRKEALATQEKLFVPELEERFLPLTTPPEESPTTIPQIPSLPSPDSPPAPQLDRWESLKYALTLTERGALSALLRGEKELKEFADTCGIMLEVLVDGINEKAMDYISDNLMDEEFVLYDDYKEQVKGLMG